MSDYTKNLSRAALLTALAVALMYFSSVLPTGRLALVAIAGVITAVAVVHCGVGWGFGVYVAAAVLSLMMLPDKGNALLYAAFLGYYPALKSLLEHIKDNRLVWVLKLVVFNLAFAALWLLAREALFPEGEILGGVWLLVQLAANVVFVIYDIGLTGLIFTYTTKIASRIGGRK